MVVIPGAAPQCAALRQSLASPFCGSRCATDMLCGANGHLLCTIRLFWGDAAGQSVGITLSCSRRGWWGAPGVTATALAAGGGCSEDSLTAPCRAGRAIKGARL